MDKKRYPNLCNPNECTACGACSTICPHDALTMLPDSHGFLHPIVSKELCSQCLLCEKTCPIVNDDSSWRNPKPDKVFAAWHKDDKIRMLSSSGGAFTAIAEYVIERGGLVWGASYDKDLGLKYKCIDNIEQLYLLRRSKYLQCEVSDTYRQIKQQLKQGKLVLFVGTSCYVRGLYHFLSKVQLENLITVDFICHGVPSPQVFKDYISWIEERYNDKLVDFSFRDKSYGWDNGVLTVGTFKEKGVRKFMGDENSYFTGMLNNMFIRESCYKCSSNGLQRHSDFTIADFWGIGRNFPYEHEKEKVKGISMVALNSVKAQMIFASNLQKRLNWSERTLEEAAAGNANYQHSSVKNPKSEAFWEQYIGIKSWNEVVKMLRPSFGQNCKIIIKRYLGPQIANILRNFLRR